MSKNKKHICWQFTFYRGLGAPHKKAFSYKYPVTLEEAKSKLIENDHDYIFEQLIEVKGFDFRFFQ